MSNLFHAMAKVPVFFMLFWPAVFIVIVYFGWTKEDIIEDQVNNIWVPQKGQMKKNRDYSDENGLDGLQGSSFAAMAIPRDGKNLFTAERLEEVRARMEKAEGTTLTWKNMTFTFQDFCASQAGFNYEFPCLRASPMDFFREARWTFNEETDLYRKTWYNELIRKELLKPRLPRFGVLQNNCAAQCADLLAHRLGPGGEPLLLFSDVGSLDMSDPCRICIETGYEATITQFKSLIPGLLLATANEISKTIAAQNLTTTQKIELGTMAKTLVDLNEKPITTEQIEEFYYYYVARSVYSALGAPAYLATYYSPAIQGPLETCAEYGALLGLPCPPLNITAQDAAMALANHADANFSSVTTAGAPMPFWDKADGTGSLLAGNSPVGGSGVDMSGNITLLVGYLDLFNYGQPSWSPAYGANNTIEAYGDFWNAHIAKNPIISWFLASVTPADPETKCGNGTLTGTNITAMLDIPLANELDLNTSIAVAQFSDERCHKHVVPSEANPGDGEYTKLHFAKMWYDLLIESDMFLGIDVGVSDPYTWTLGVGCGYNLGGMRDEYRGMSEKDVLLSASRPLYTIDEGESVGAISVEMLMDTTPIIGDYNATNPLTKVGLIQSFYSTLKPAAVVEKVKSCKRPGGPLDVTEDEIIDVLYIYKEEFENAWTKGWDDDDDGELQFVGFFDDSGVVGSTGRMLEEITLDNTLLTAVSILLIGVFSILFLCKANMVESRVLVTIVGVALVVLAYFAGVGFALLTGIKVSVTIAWTLPFIILGLGVDDMYIVLHALNKQSGSKKHDFLLAMKEVLVPVTMTSVVNASMFAILNISDIPAIYLSARVADYCVIALYIAIILCFPAYCYLDMRRQDMNRMDICCIPSKKSSVRKEDFRSVLLYDKLYEPLILGHNRSFRLLVHAIIWIVGIGVVGTGAYGITKREVGLGLEDFFPSSRQTSVWATRRTESLAAWPIEMRWGEVDLEDPKQQMLLIKSFEDVVGSPHVAEADTKQIWLPNFLMWTTQLCTNNFNRDDFETKVCGMDIVYKDDKTCKGTWAPNDLGLREKQFSDWNDPNCYTHERGICRPIDRIHPLDRAALDGSNATSYCPVVKDWDADQWQFCLSAWRRTTGFTGGLLQLEQEYGTPKECAGEYETDEPVKFPVKISGSPTLFSFNLFSHEDTLDMMDETRSVCEDSDEIHCFLTGIPYDYWSQYEGIFGVLFQLCAYSTLVGFAISFFFLYLKLSIEQRHSHGKIFSGSLVGAFMIALTIVLSLVSVTGLSILFGVNLTAFSNMSFVLSVAFAVEYAVHIVARWLRAHNSITSSLDRVRYTMSFLMLPTFMSFVSSTIGVACLAFTEFEFNQVFFFRPLIIVMIVTYFYGVWWLPVALTFLDFDAVKLGKVGELNESKLPPEKAVSEDEISVRRENFTPGKAEL